MLRCSFALLLTVAFLLFPMSVAAEERPDVTMRIEVHPDQAGRIRIFTQKAYHEDLDFKKDIIYVPFVSDSWDPELRIETEGPVSVEYTPGNIVVLPTGPGTKHVKVWFTADGRSSTSWWGGRAYAAGWLVRPAFEELGHTRIMARTVFPPGVNPNWSRNGIRIGDSTVTEVSQRRADQWEIDDVLEPGEIALIEVGYTVPSGTMRQLMITSSLALSLAAFILALWTATRPRDVGSL